MNQGRHKKQHLIWAVGLLHMSVWSLVLGGLLIWERQNELRQNNEVLLYQARAFTQQITTTRHWIAAQGGVYAPISKDLQPNPYLPVAGRDLTTIDGQKLTKINPSFMTRQLSELAASDNNISFHLTSLNPIRPENAPDTWEQKTLQSFSATNTEHFEVVTMKGGKPLFRYMIPFLVTEDCLQCHAQQGYKLGDQRGGLSLAIQLDPLVKAHNDYFQKTTIIFFAIWVLSLIGIAYGFFQIKKGDDARLELIDKLEKALAEVKELKGLLPICASCKKIRDDKGYWQQIEVYISERSDAQFSHGICLDCAKKLYPELYDELDAAEEKALLKETEKTDQLPLS